MQKNDIDELFRNAVRVDLKNHIDARKGNLEPWETFATLNLLNSYPDEINVKWIKDEIEKRENMLKLNQTDFHLLNLELIALNRLKRNILTNYPNSFD